MIVELRNNYQILQQDDYDDSAAMMTNMIMIKLPIMWSFFYLGASDFAWQQIFLIPQDDENNDDDKNNDNDDDADNNNNDDDEPEAEDKNYLKIANFQPNISRLVT